MNIGIRILTFFKEACQSGSKTELSGTAEHSSSPGQRADNLQLSAYTYDATRA